MFGVEDDWFNRPFCTESKQKDKRLEITENLNKQLQAKVQKHLDDNKLVEEKHKEAMNKSKELIEKYQKDLIDNKALNEKSSNEIAALSQQIGKRMHCLIL